MGLERRLAGGIAIWLAVENVGWCLIKCLSRLISTGGAKYQFVTVNGLVGQHGVEMRMEAQISGWIEKAVNRECSVAEDDF